MGGTQKEEREKVRRLSPPQAGDAVVGVNGFD